MCGNFLGASTSMLSPRGSFSARNRITVGTNFGGLVLGCIEADLQRYRIFLQHFRARKHMFFCPAPNSTFSQKIHHLFDRKQYLVYQIIASQFDELVRFHQTLPNIQYWPNATKSRGQTLPI